MIDIKELFEKETVSGEDVGKLIIYNDIYTYKNQIGTLCPDKEYKPLTQKDLDSIVEKINTIEEAEILECYVQLQNFIRYAQAVSFAYNQQAQNGFCRLMMYMTQAQHIEHARKMIEMLPIIMTESQFMEMEPPGALTRLRGVAIVANNFPCRPKCLDAQDNFIEPEIDCFQEMMSFEHCGIIAEKIEYFRNNLLLDGLKYQMAYNKLFELIAERIDIPEFVVFCTDLEKMKKQIENFNIQRENFANEISEEGSEYLNKLEILNNVFRAIEIEGLEPSEKAVEKVRRRMKDISVFRKSMNELVSILLNSEVG